MNIAYITNIRIPTEKAHGIQVMKMCEAFASVGQNIELIVPQRINSIKTSAFDFYKVAVNFRITKIWCLDFLALSILKWVNFWLQTVSFLVSVKLFLQNKKFDIYYTRDFLLAIFLYKKNVKIIYEIHSMPERGLWLHKRAWNRADHLVVISDGLQKALLVYGIDSNKIILARDAVDFDIFQVAQSKEEARKKLCLPIDKKIVVYTGHLYKWKGADALAQAAEFLPNIEIFLVGGTKQDVVNFKTNYKFSNLHIFGWQEHHLIPLWLKAADILVLPNSAREKIGAEYTSPLKLFEYMASGTPIIASSVSALREVINEDCAIFFEPDNIFSLVQSIEFGINNYSKLQENAARALKRVSQFTWYHRAELILKHIKNV